MTTIYETKKPVFNNNEKYLYVVNSIKKVPDGFEPYEQMLMQKIILVESIMNIKIET